MLCNFFSRLFSRTFLAGLLTGIVIAVGGLYAYAQVRVRMGGSEQPNQKRYLSPVDVSDSTARSVQGRVPSNWALRPLDGTEATTFGMLPKRPTLLTVGATWCEPCTAKISVLQALHDSIGQDVRVMFVSPEPRDSIRQYVGDEGYTMPTYVVNTLPPLLSGDLLPRTYLVRPDGTVTYKHVGPADWTPDIVRRLLESTRTSAVSRPTSESAHETLYAQTRP